MFTKYRLSLLFHNKTQLFLKFNLYWCLLLSQWRRIHFVRRDPHRCLKSRGALRPPTPQATGWNSFCPECHNGVLFFLQALKPLSCEYKMENVTRMVVCDLGNPMVTGTNVRVPAVLTDLRLIGFYRGVVENSPISTQQTAATADWAGNCWHGGI